MIRSQQAIAKNATTPTAGRMGPLELAVYKSDWKSSQVYRRHVEDVAARRELEAAAQAAQDQILKAAGMKADRSEGAGARKPGAVASRHSAIPSPTVTGMSKRRNAMSRRRHPAASPPDCCWRGYSTTIPP